MKWINKEKIYEILTVRLSIHDYKNDYKFDFENNRIGSELVSGQDAFIQKFKKVLLTEKTPLIRYGLADLLPTSRTQEEFAEQCTELANAILEHQFSDSKPDNPNGLGHTVRKVHQIEYDVDSRHYSFILAVTGLEETIKVSLEVLSPILE